MRSLLLYPLFALPLLLATSCKQEADEVQPATSSTFNPQTLDPATAFLRAAQSSALPADEYISGEFDGTPLLLAADPAPGQSGLFYTNPSQHNEYGVLTRATPAGDMQVSVTFTNTDLFSQALPATYPRANRNNCEQLLIDVRAVAPSGGPAATPPSWFQGCISSNSPMHVVITSTANGMVEGTFEGRFYQLPYTSDIFYVKNGKFRLKATVVPM